jgi:hypothetical protein
MLQNLKRAQITASIEGGTKVTPDSLSGSLNPFNNFTYEDPSDMARQASYAGAASVLTDE